MIVDRLMLTIKAENIGDDDNLEKMYKIDSPRLMELVIGLEEYFDIQLGDDEFSIRKFSTVKGIADVVRAKNPDA